MTQQGLSPLEWQAVSVVGRQAKHVREEVDESDRQDVDLLLRIQGTVSVGADGQTTKAKKPTAEQVLAFVLKHLEPAPDVQDSMLNAMRAAAAANNGELPESEEAWHALARQAIENVSPRTSAARKGSVRGSLSVGLVDQDELSPRLSGQIGRLTRAIILEEE